jgi:predicted nucleotidyltransferase
METKLTRPIIRVGNSAGVLLPKEWLNGKAEIELIQKPLNLRADIMEILDEYLEDILGIYLVGSYARGEQTSESDVDVLVITNKFREKIKKGKYDFWLITKEELEGEIRRSALPLLPMLMEAKSIINTKLIDSYKFIKLNKKNLKFHIETTKSALKISRETIEILKLKEENKCSDSLIYSIILRLREAYIVDCLINKTSFNNKELKRIIKEVSGSLESYEAYKRSKNNKKSLKIVSLEEAESLINYVNNKIISQEQWIKKEGSR